MNPAIVKFATQTASVIVSTLVSYGVITIVEHAVEGIRRQWWKKNEKSSETKTSNQHNKGVIMTINGHLAFFMVIMVTTITEAIATKIASKH